MTQINCLVAGRDIGARDCVEAQVTARCWCSKATLAVLEISEVAVAGSKLAEKVSTCKNAAQAMFRKPAAERYDGPALRKIKGLPDPVEVPLPEPKGYEPPEEPAPTAFMVEGALDAPARRVAPEVNVDEREDLHEASIAAAELGHAPPEVPTKASSWNEFQTKKEAKRALEEEENAPPPPPAVCKIDGCRTALKVNNTSGLCQMHRQQVSSRQRKKLVPVVARAAGTVGNALAAEVDPALVPPVICAKAGCNRPTRSKTGYCSPCQHDHEDDKAANAKRRGRRCATEGCVFVFQLPTKPGTRCRKCRSGIRVGSGFEPCETENCPKKVHRFRGHKKCAFCRRGLKHHLRPSNDGKKHDVPAKPAAKEAVMARVFCACKREIRTGRDGVRHEKCLKCRRGDGGASDGHRPPPVVRKKSTAAKRSPVPEEAIVDVFPTKPPVTALGFDPKAFSVEQLAACAYELRQRIAQLEEQKRAAEFALAGEPLTEKRPTPMKKTG